MRIRTIAGLAVAGAAGIAAVVGGAAYAAADDEPIVRIVTEEPAAENAVQPDDSQPREDCPEKGGAPETAPESAPSTSGTGL
jgi:hypothetical protein